MSTTIGKPRIIQIMCTILGFFGLWLPDSTIIYRIYSVLLHFNCTFVYTSALVIALFFSNAKDNMNSIGMIMTLVALNVKVLNFFIHYRTIHRCLIVIGDFELFDKDEEQRKAERVRMFTIVAAILYFTGNTAGMSVYLAAHRARVLPFVAWYPFELSFWWMYSYQVVAMVMLSNVNMTMELLPSYLMFMVSIKMEILGMRLKKLGEGITNKGVYMKEDTNEQLIETSKLSQCIQTHQSILKCTTKIEESFTLGMFAQITASAVILCTVAIQLTFSKPSDGIEQYAFYITFFISITAQCCLPCYFGHELITRSEELMNCCYGGNWHQMSRRFRSILIILLERLKRISVIQACKLFPLSLETFRTIMSFTYKLYALVANLN